MMEGFPTGTVTGSSKVVTIDDLNKEHFTHLTFSLVLTKNLDFQVLTKKKLYLATIKSLNQAKWLNKFSCKREASLGLAGFFSL